MFNINTKRILEKLHTSGASFIIEHGAQHNTHVLSFEPRNRN